MPANIPTSTADYVPKYPLSSIKGPTSPTKSSPRSQTSIPINGCFFKQSSYNSHVITGSPLNYRQPDPKTKQSAAKNVRISDLPPAIIGYDGGGDYAWDGSSSVFAFLAATGQVDDEDDEEKSSSDECDGDRVDGSGKIYTKEERRRWALQTALNTERNAITKNLCPSPTLVPYTQSTINGKGLEDKISCPEKSTAPGSPSAKGSSVGAFRVRAWGERGDHQQLPEPKSLTLSVSSKINKTQIPGSTGCISNGNISLPSKNTPSISPVSYSPSMITCKPICKQIITPSHSKHSESFSLSHKPSNFKEGSNTESKDVPDSFRLDILGHISDFLLAENEKNNEGEKSLLEEIAESFKSATSTGPLNHSPKSEPTIVLVSNSPLDRGINVDEKIRNEPNLALMTNNYCLSEDPILITTTIKSINLENKSFLFSHTGLLGKLCTVASSIQRSMISHTVVTTTTAAPQVVTKSSHNASPLKSSPLQSHLYDLIESIDDRHKLEQTPNRTNNLDVPDTRNVSNITVITKHSVANNNDTVQEAKSTPIVTANSQFIQEPKFSPDRDRVLGSPVYEELDYAPPSSSSTSSTKAHTVLKRNLVDDALTNFVSAERITLTTKNEPTHSLQSFINEAVQGSSNTSNPMGYSNESAVIKCGKRNVVASFFGKSTPSTHKSHHHPITGNLLGGLGGGNGASSTTSHSSRRSTREIRKEDIFVLLTSPHHSVASDTSLDKDIPQFAKSNAAHVSSPPFSSNNMAAGSSNTIIRFDSKLASVAKNINDTNGDRCLNLEVTAHHGSKNTNLPTITQQSSIYSTPALEDSTDKHPWNTDNRTGINNAVSTKRNIVANNGSYPITEHSSLPLLTSSSSNEKAAFVDNTKSNSLDTNHPVKYDGAVELQFVSTLKYKSKAVEPAVLERVVNGTTFEGGLGHKLVTPPKPIPSQVSGIRSLLNLNGNKKRNGTLRSKSLDKSTAGAVPSLLSIMDIGNSTLSFQSSDDLLIMASNANKKSHSSKPKQTFSAADLNKVLSSSAVSPKSMLSPIATTTLCGDSQASTFNQNYLASEISCRASTFNVGRMGTVGGGPLVGSSGGGKFSSLKKFFRKSSASGVGAGTGNTTRHQRSSLASLRERTSMAGAMDRDINSTGIGGAESSSPVTNPSGSRNHQQQATTGSSYDDSGVSSSINTRLAASEDDYGCRRHKNPSYSSALDSFSSEENWSVSSASNDDNNNNNNKMLLQQQQQHATCSGDSNQQNVHLNTHKLAPLPDAIRSSASLTTTALQSTPLPPIPVRAGLTSACGGSDSNEAFGLTMPCFTGPHPTNTSSSSELEFSGEGVVTSRSHIMRNNASPIQRPVGKPRVPPPKPPVNSSNVLPSSRNMTRNQSGSFNEPPQGGNKSNVESTINKNSPNDKLKTNLGQIKKPDVPARPPKLTSRSLQALGKGGNVSIGKKCGRIIGGIVNKDALQSCNVQSNLNDPDVSDMPRRKPPPPPPIILLRQEKRIDPTVYYDPLMNNPVNVKDRFSDAKDLSLPFNQSLTKRSASSEAIPTSITTNNNPFYEEYLIPVCSVNGAPTTTFKNTQKFTTNATSQCDLSKKLKLNQRHSEGTSNKNSQQKKLQAGKISEDQRNLIISGLKPSQIKKNQREKVAMFRA